MLLASIWCLGFLLNDQPWPMPHECSTGDSSPTHLIAQHQQRTTSARAVILVRPVGGLGNELDVVLHAFLHALATGKPLLVTDTPLMRYFAKTPLWSLVDSAAVSLLASANISVQTVPSENGLPFSPKDHHLWKSLWNTRTHNVSTLVSCASHALFQPNASVAHAMAPYLEELGGYHDVIGVHLRTSDVEMAGRNNITRRRLSLEMTPRRGCKAGGSLIREMVACAKSTVRKGSLTYYVASDSSALFRKLRDSFEEAVPTVRVITSSGEPYHTGRALRAPPADGSDPTLKALVDFFVMGHVGRFFSNCDFLSCFEGVQASLWGSHSDEQDLMRRATGSSHTTHSMRACGNTYAGNIWIRRFVLDARSPRLNACLRSTGKDAKCAQTPLVDDAPPRAKHKIFEPLGNLSRPPTSCGLASYPELVEGSKKGDDDKILCSIMLRELRPDDVIVSIGSNNEFGFEEQMLGCTNSHIATFDCTVANATNKPLTSRVSFHPYCIGLADTTNYRTWTSLSELALQAAQLHSVAAGINKARPPRIAVLKADIEGWEWVVLDEVVHSVVPSSLPQQIAVEIHLRTQAKSVPGFKTQAKRNVPGFPEVGGFPSAKVSSLPNPTGKLQQLRARMAVAGYELINRNDNPWCNHCSEVLFVHVHEQVGTQQPDQDRVGTLLNSNSSREHGGASVAVRATLKQQVAPAEDLLVAQLQTDRGVQVAKLASLDAALLAAKHGSRTPQGSRSHAWT